MIKYCLVFFYCFYSSVKGFSQSTSSYRYSPSDSSFAFASRQYNPSFLQRVIMGSNYRKDWQTVVKLPVLRLSASAFTVKALGGGMQTKSLRLVDSAGRPWALRTVDKDVSGAMPSWARNTLAEKLMQDLISSSFPYGATVAASLAQAAGVYNSEPRLFIVADDTALGPYKQFFANTICLLEERSRGYDSILNSRTLFTLVKKENDGIIHQKILLRARLLDMLIGDWDRHEDNWRWGLKDSAGINIYHALPTDRDWAFYRSKGLLPNIIRFVALPYLDGFKTKMHVQPLSFKNWLFDKTLLSELTRADWENEIKEFTGNISDKAIESAVKTMPPPIYVNEGKAFVTRLQSRRNLLQKEAMRYYEFISEEAVVNGSDEAEVFVISGTENGITVSVFQKKEGVKGRELFRRSYLPGETKHIIINGFGGEDVFMADVVSKSPKIKVTVNGGTGSDTYDFKGKSNVTVNDASSDNNLILNKSTAKFRFH